MEKKTEEGNTTHSKTQLIIVFLVGFLLGLLVGPTFAGDKADQLDVDDQVMEESVENMTEGEKEMNSDGNVVVTPSKSVVEVDDQLAGDRVTIKSVSFEKDGWVVVHESINGVPANALGAQRFDAGEALESHVDLLRNTEVGAEYFVILYNESGDGEFSLEDDKPLTGLDGKILSKSFNTIQIDRKN